METSGEQVHVARRPTNRIEAEHLARYQWAAERAVGRVLDAACGTGYGSALFEQVVGIDKDAASVEAARVAAPHGRFIVGELPDLPFPDSSFETVVSFETIEHLDDGLRFLGETHRVLSPDGQLMLSTPNRTLSKNENPWHVREYTIGELHDILAGAGFSDIETFGQTVERRSWLGRQAYRAYARFPWLQDTRNPLAALPYGSVAVRRIDQPVYWVLHCQRA
jgi:SAM-dependent methyltransferase